ncbi:hypothetical protein VroAM7_26100 [Vibrio rotiferianus]|uniref:Uncharacterized protein n=1 Tax=Vibrio rotiferianus TaxID=190895 RepID=A0A510I8Q9_9VIBR|nr:hypothetical protein VroAM7_26100 [Vibrio rotiferianus]
MIKVFIKYDFIHSNTHKWALVMSKLTVELEKQCFEFECLSFWNRKVDARGFRRAACQ